MKYLYSILILFFLLTKQATAQVGINTQSPNENNIENVALDVNGKMIIRDLSQIDSRSSNNLTQVGVDNNGLLVKMSNMTNLLGFYQSTVGTKYTDATTVNSFNSGSEFLITWTSSEEIINTDMLNFNNKENSFEFKYYGLYDISGVINFGINMGSSYYPNIADKVALNVTIQYARSGGTTWTDLTSSRVLYVGGELTYGYVAKTIIIPPALFEFNTGDRIRLIVKKPFGNTVSAFEISKPTGATISKQIKVVRM